MFQIFIPDECVCVYVKAENENSSFCISGTTEPIDLEFSMHLKQAQPFVWYYFR